MYNTQVDTSFEKLNIRQLQAYAAVCLKEYTKKQGIKHIEVDKLVLHLFEILVVDDLPKWEQTCSALQVSGRGSPIPDGVIAVVPTQCLDAFSMLVEYCVEVGIVDMYGAPSELPLQFLGKCLSILNKSNVQPPSVRGICEAKKGDDVWGEPISYREYQNLIDDYQL